MISSKKFSALSAAVFTFLLLAACAAKPVLLPKSAVVPPGVDFSGRWQLQVEPGAGPSIIEPREPGIRIPPANSRRDAIRQPAGRSSRAAIHVFIENGESLKISQTPAGLFISFDRAIVEEYTFGEDRVVSVGPIEAQRVSGWEGDSLIVQTRDDEGSVLTESWRLTEGDGVLLRTISVTRGDRESLSAEQRFERI